MTGVLFGELDPGLDEPDPLLEHADMTAAVATAVAGGIGAAFDSWGAPSWWALLQGRSYVVPADVELLFAPVVMHRIVFRPSFLAEVRRSGWIAAAAQLQAQCLASAPPPGH